MCCDTANVLNHSWNFDFSYQNLKGGHLNDEFNPEKVGMESENNENSGKDENDCRKTGNLWKLFRMNSAIGGNRILVRIGSLGKSTIGRNRPFVGIGKWWEWMAMDGN